MDVTIPGILAGGEGRAIQQAGAIYRRPVKPLPGFVDKIQENYDYNDASDLKNEAELKSRLITWISGTRKMGRMRRL